jgi:hypothetical protein
MKAAAIALSVLVLAFLVNVVGIFIFPAYKLKIQEVVGTKPKVEAEMPAASNAAYKDDIAKLQDTIEKLTIGLNAVQTGSIQPAGVPATAIPAVTGAVPARPSIGTAAPPANAPVVPTQPPKPKEYALSIPLQAKLMPDVFVKKGDNKGIFDIKIYTNLDYTTYRDDKHKLNIYAFSDSYSVILANLKLASNVYVVKETDSFFEASFFLNSTNAKDTTIRFVTAIEGKAYGFEVPKAYYPRLKKLLTNK